MRLRTMLAVAAAVIAPVAGPVAPTAVAVPCFPTVKISDAGKVFEDQGPMQFVVTMTDWCGSLAPNSSVSYSTSPFVPGEQLDAGKWFDYEPAVGTLYWSPGDDPTQVISISLVSDGYNEPLEDLGVKLLSSTGLRIIDDFGMGTISTPWCVAVVADGVCPFNIQLPEPATTSVSVRYTTIDGTARAGEDFVGVRDGLVTIPAGGSRAVFSVLIRPNRPDEPEEYFDLQINLINATTGAAIDSGRSTVAIRQ